MTWARVRYLAAAVAIALVIAVTYVAVTRASTWEGKSHVGPISHPIGMTALVNDDAVNTWHGYKRLSPVKIVGRRTPAVEARSTVNDYIYCRTGTSTVEGGNGLWWNVQGNLHVRWCWTQYLGPYGLSKITSVENVWADCRTRSLSAWTCRQDQTRTLKIAEGSYFNRDRLMTIQWRQFEGDFVFFRGIWTIGQEVRPWARGKASGDGTYKATHFTSSFA